MEKDDDDEIVKEIPVFLSQELANQLYLFQYPITPLASDLLRAKVLGSQFKPEHQEVKIELELDSTSKCYDISKGEEIAINADGDSNSIETNPSACFRSGVMDKYCYSGSGAFNKEDIHKYAIGRFKDNEIQCTPLAGIISLRPDFSYFDKSDKRTKSDDAAEKTEKETEVDDEEIQQVTVKFAKTECDKVRKAREKSYDFLSKKSEEEPWCDTKFYKCFSHEAELEKMKLISLEEDDIGHALQLTKSEYLRTLIPSEDIVENEPSSLPSHILSLNSLKTLPLVDQCKLLLKDARLITFQNLSLLLAQDSSTTDKLLKALPQAGLLIRGCWTARSEVIYPAGTRSSISGVPAELMCRGRDYVLYLFNESQYLDRRKIASATKLPPDEVKEILTSVAEFKYGKGWQLLIQPDTDFEEKNQDIVQRQALFWEAKHKQFSEMATCSPNSKKSRKRSQRESISVDDLILPKGVNQVNGSEEAIQCNGVNPKKIMTETNITETGS